MFPLAQRLENAMFDHIEAFYQPATVREALRLLHSRTARPLAGGTDLALLRDRSIRILVDLSHLGLDKIRRNDSGSTIGAGCSMAALEHSSIVRGLADGILSHAAATCGSVQIRNIATIGGNLAHGSPAADTATPLLAMDAIVVLQNDGGRKRVSLREFFALPQTSRARRGLLVEVVIPKIKGRAGWSFQKFGRTETDISIVNAAAGLGVARDGTCAWARLALGAVAPTPIRATDAEALLTGRPITRKLVERAAEAVMHEVQPISDLRASADYRREISRVLARRALHECAQRAGCTV